MANVFSDDLIPRILGSFQEVLREETPLLQRVENDFGKVGMSIGDTATIQIPDQSGTVQNVVPGPIPVTPANKTPLNAKIKLANWIKDDFFLTELDAKKVLAGLFRDTQIAASARKIANKVNGDLLALGSQLYGYVGTAGTNFLSTNVNNIADAKLVLDKQLCPDYNRMLVLGAEEVNAGLKTADLKAAYAAGTAQALRQGIVGSVNGMETLMDINRPFWTAGTKAGALTCSAASAGVNAVTVTTASSTGSCALKAGDVVTFSNDTAIDSTYVLTADATQASASSTVVVNFNPALKTALSGSETVSVKASHFMNLAVDPKCFGAIACTPAELGAGIEALGYKRQISQMTLPDPISGLPLTVTIYEQYHQIAVECSLAYGVGVIDPRRGVRCAS